MNKQITTSSKIYAESLIQISDQYNSVQNDLSVVFDVLHTSHDLYSVLTNPSIRKELKYDVIDEVFKPLIDDKIINFVKILIDVNKISELSEIIAAYSEMVDNILNVQSVDVISAIELNEIQKDTVISKLKEKFKKTIKSNWVVNDDIIGGLIIKTNDIVIDCSIKNKLENLSKI